MTFFKKMFTKQEPNLMFKKLNFITIDVSR